MTLEIWRDIAGYENLYQVNNFGQIKSLLAKKLLKGRPARHGYLRVALYRDGVPKNYSIHRLVAAAFLDKRDDQNEVNHKNGIKTDNYLVNLEWATRSENMQHASLNGYVQVGENKFSSKLKNEDIIKIRQLIFSKSIFEISNIYGINHKSIRGILLGETWKHIPYPDKKNVIELFEKNEQPKAFRANNIINRLTPLEIKEIKSLKGKIRQEELAAKFNISKSSINIIQSSPKWVEA